MSIRCRAGPRNGQPLKWPNWRRLYTHQTSLTGRSPGALLTPGAILERGAHRAAAHGRNEPDVGRCAACGRGHRSGDRPVDAEPPTAPKRSPRCRNTVPTWSSWTSGCRRWMAWKPPGASSSQPGRGCRIIILTTFDLDQYVYAALTAGASGFLLKDVSPAQLVAAVRLVRSGDALLAPSVTRRLVERFAPQSPGRPMRAPAARWCTVIYPSSPHGNLRCYGCWPAASATPSS